MIGGFSASLLASGRPTKEQIDDEMGAGARYEEKKKLKKSKDKITQLKKR